MKLVATNDKQVKGNEELFLLVYSWEMSFISTKTFKIFINGTNVKQTNKTKLHTTKTNKGIQCEFLNGCIKSAKRIAVRFVNDLCINSISNYIEAFLILKGILCNMIARFLGIHYL